MSVQDLGQSVGLGQALHDSVEETGVAQIGQTTSLLNVHSLFGIESGHTVRKQNNHSFSREMRSMKIEQKPPTLSYFIFTKFSN